MTSVDDLFKRPSLLSGSSKRKFESPDADRAYKTTKLAANASPNHKQASVDEIDDDDLEAGPALPPEADDHDDEEGRFFGGGISGNAAEALDYVDQQDGSEDFAIEQVDAAWLKRLSTSFERKVVKNAELRSRYDGQAEKFMASEADLDDEIKSWSLLTDHPELYTSFAKGAAPTLVGLLAHENTDIAIDVIQIISELLDEDVEAEPEQWESLASAMLDADLIDLLLSNLTRLDEDNEADRPGIYHSLAALESLASQQIIAERIGQEKLLIWLCKRMSQPEALISQNKQYAAEVLHVMLQISSVVQERMVRDLDAVDLYLQLASAYRKRDPPKDSTEAEYAENLFDGLTCLLDNADGKLRFIEAEGIELALIMLKEGKFSKTRALRLLDHAVGGKRGAREVCERLVEAAGLKTLFGQFMKKTDASTTEHLIGIFSALLRQLPQDSDARVRVLMKFEENDFEKVARLVSLRSEYAQRVGAINEEIKLERRMMDEEDWEEREAEWYSRRLDAGLFTLQIIDVILAWLVAEHIGADATIHSGGREIMTQIRQSLQDQAEDTEDDDTREMLKTLASFVDYKE